MSVNRTSNYSDFLNSVSALIGVDQGDLQTTELTFLNAFFNRAIRKAWESQVWQDFCPYGEVRFPVNLIADPKLIGAGTALPSPTWSASGTFINSTSSTIANPLDNNLNVRLVSETAVTSTHYIQPGGSVYFAPNQPYSVNGYAQPNPYGARNWLWVTVYDGVSTFTAFYNLTQPTATVGTVTVSGGAALPTASISQSASGFYQFNLSLTASMASTGSGYINVGFSPDGVTTSYLGNAALGMNLWGITCFLSQNILPASYYIPWSQYGEQAIDAVFNVWANDPGGAFIPRNVNMNLTQYGIEVISPSAIGGLYLYYRPQRPNFAGAVFNAASTYAAGQTMYYTSTGTLTSGNLNYYTALAATTAGQTPDSNPSLWSVMAFPYVLFPYVVYNAYADWLGTEGQTAKAQAMYGYAQSCLDDENDRQERQMGLIQPWTVSTHITSQNRGMGYQGQNFSPNGTYYVN